MSHKYLTRSAINAFWICLGFTILLCSFKSNVIISSSFANKVRLLFPEGWGFFTKDPKESLFDVYSVNRKNNSLNKLDFSNVSSENSFGFSRRARMKGYEIAVLLSKFSSKDWVTDTTSNIESHIFDKPLLVRTPWKFEYFKKGELLFKQRKPVPWQWSNRDQEKYTPFNTLKIIINE